MGDGLLADKPFGRIGGVARAGDSRPRMPFGGEMALDGLEAIDDMPFRAGGVARPFEGAAVIDAGGVGAGPPSILDPPSSLRSLSADCKAKRASSSLFGRMGGGFG